MLTINRRWNLLCVGFDNKELAWVLSIPFAIAVGNKRDYSSVDVWICKGQVLGERLSSQVAFLNA